MERLGADAARLLRAARVARPDQLAAIVAAWPGCVGDGVARAAWPQRLARDGTLHVATVSSTWAFELGRLAPEIAARLRERLGERAPSGLRFAPGPVPAAAADEASLRPPPAPPPSAETAAEAARLTAAVADPALRQLIARAAASSLERGRSGRGFC